MKFTLKYKDYGSHVRTRLLVDDSHVGSPMFTKQEFEAFKGVLERGCANSGLELAFIEIQSNFQVGATGPEDDAFLSRKSLGS